MYRFFEHIVVETHIDGLGVCYEVSQFTIVMYVRYLQSETGNRFHLVGLWTWCTRATGIFTAIWQIVIGICRCQEKVEKFPNHIWAFLPYVKHSKIHLICKQ